MADEERLMWTFQLVGGEPFNLEVPLNPPAVHNGNLSIWHLRVTKTQAKEIETLAGFGGVRVTTHCEVETEEQSKIHQRFHESGESLFACLQCVECYWLDLQTEGYCGLRSWPRERADAALEGWKGAFEDAARCPVAEWVRGPHRPGREAV